MLNHVCGSRNPVKSSYPAHNTHTHTRTRASVLHTNPNTHVKCKKGRRRVISDVHGAEISLAVLWEKVTVDLMRLVNK